MALPDIPAPAAFDITADGWVTYAKDPDTPRVPASTLKCVTLYVARKHIDDTRLDEPVEVTQEDMTTGTVAGLQAGDIVTWHDLFLGMMLPSGNDAARAIGRLIGQTLPGSDSPLVKFRRHMAEVTAADFGWPYTTFGSTSGFPDSTSRLTVRQLCQLVHAWDDYSVSVGGTLTHQVVVTGPNARTFTLRHTTDPDGAVKFPEFVSAKPGTITSYTVANIVMLWDDQEGRRHATAVYGSWPGDQRYVDLRAVMDYVETLEPPPPDPDPVGPTLRFTDGRPATLHRTDGTPIAL